MKSFTMKALALATLSLAGMGSAMAACPTDPAAPAGAWSSKTVTQGNLAITTPGMAATACRLQVSLNQGSALFAKSLVTDTSPANEARFRARFYIDTTEVTGLTSVLRQAKVFNATATTSPANLSGEEVTVALNGSTGAPTAVFSIADSTQGSGFRVVSVALPVANGANRIEFDLQTGTNGTFRYWVTDAATATTDAAPTGTVTGINDSGWSGIKLVNLGVFTANGGWRSNYGAANHLYFDEYDSRRATFIGM